MRLILCQGTVLVEPVMEPTPLGIIVPEDVLTTQVALVRQSACESVSVGDRILHAPRAGLNIRSNGNRFLLLDAADVLARLV